MTHHVLRPWRGPALTMSCDIPGRRSPRYAQGAPAGARSRLFCALLCTVTLAGCGMPYEEGMLRRGELNCELAEACGTVEFFGGSVEACKETAAAQGYDEADCPDYDAEAMRECVEAYEGAVADGACDGETLAALGEACAVCG